MYTYLGLISYLDYLGKPLFKSVIQEKNILFFDPSNVFLVWSFKLASESKSILVGTPWIIEIQK